MATFRLTGILDQGADASRVRPLFSVVVLASAVLDPVGLVAALAFVVDGGERCLEGIEILDLALCLADRLGKARRVGFEALSVGPDFCRSVVVAFRLQAFDAVRNQRRKTLADVL